MATDQLIEKMIARRVKYHGHEGEQRAHFSELCQAHDGDNLAAALVYLGFATERQAYRYLASL